MKSKEIGDKKGMILTKLTWVFSRRGDCGKKGGLLFRRIAVLTIFELSNLSN